MSIITFNANPLQKQFIESRAEADLFSSRMGEGKSAALCWAVFWHTRNNPGAKWLIMRDTWVNLERTTQEEFFEWFGQCGTYKAEPKTFTWRLDGMGEGTVIFMGAEDAKDVSKLQSLKLAGVAMDEPAPAAESGGIAEEIFDGVHSRLRQKGMKWYAAKLAQNNPDENHWSYRRFVDPGTSLPQVEDMLPEQTPGFALWHTDKPENEQNLPPGYYERLRLKWAHRPDYVARFVDGEFGYISKGKKVTPEWNDSIHLATGLAPLKMEILYLLWDFGLNPTCIITQVTPIGHWNIIESFVGDGIGVAELIEDRVKPTLTTDYKGCTWEHVGDPAGKMREQSSSMSSAVKEIKKQLGGRWHSGPVKIAERIDPLNAVLRKTTRGRGLVQVDRRKAKEVWLALRGGWHRHVSRTGLTSEHPVKDEHSHPGDAMGYGAAYLYPLGRLQKNVMSRPAATATYFNKGGLGFEKPHTRIPEHGEELVRK